MDRRSVANFGLFPIWSALPIQDMNIHNANSIGGNKTSEPLYWRGVYILNRQGGGGLHGIAYLKSQLDAPILLAQI
jgi:hypothetical protein